MIRENLRILLVEDDGDDYIITKDLLSEIKGASFRLDWAKSFDKALELMVSNQHDTYLVDYRLGAHDGIELLRLALTRGCQSPIILLTGQGEHEIDIAAMEAGAADYLVKTDLTADDLERSIRYALERKRAQAVAAFEHARLAAFGAEVGLALTREDSLEAILQRCARAMLQYLNASQAEILVYNEAQKCFKTYASAGEPTDSTAEAYSTLTPEMIGALARGEPLLVKTVSEDSRLAKLAWLQRKAIASYVAYPLVLEERLTGLMSICSPVTLTESVLREMESVANGIALCIERHLSKEALEQSEVKYRAVVDNSREVIFQTDKQGNWTFLNPAWEGMTGFKLSESIGKPFTEYLHADDRERNRKVFSQLIEGELNCSRHEARYLTKQGQTRWAETYFQFLPDRTGSVLGVTGTLTDITERQQAAEQIQKLAAFPQVNPNPVLEFAADGTLSYFNEAASELAKALNKDHPLAILPPNPGELAKECLASGQKKLREEIVINGQTINWSFFPIAAGKVVHCYGVDITERLNLEAQFRHSQKLESVGQLAAGIAHDFNNILTVIQGHADLILAHNGNTDATTRQLTQISVAAKRASSLTRQLLTFSRKQVIQTQRTDLNSVIRNLAKMLPRLLGEDVAFEVKCGERSFPVEVDVGMIEQVVMNLAVNARDAMPKGGMLTLSTREVELDEAAKQAHHESRASRFVCLSVKDTGCGMSQETLDRIFEPFYTTKEVGKGTGLGLASAYGIVKQHQGWIEVTSELHVGTTFKVFIPITSQVEAIREKLEDPSPAGRGRNETILVVEDEPNLRAMVRDSLSEHGYKVLQAGQGVEALDVCRKHDNGIDLVLTDIVMPEGMTGFELGQKIRARKPDMKIIYTTGYSADVLGRDLTASDLTFLLKPYSLQQLFRVVREYLDIKEPVLNGS